MDVIYSKLEWTEISKVRNAIQRTYEPIQIYFFTQLADWMGCTSFWDIGANIGTFSMAMAQLRTVERVHAFEPMPTLHQELSANAHKNDLLGKIVLHSVAVSNQNAPVEFAVLGNYSGANGVAATLMHDQDAVDHKITVQAQTLDTVTRNGNPPPYGPCFLKIDVEGHELSVLAGAVEMLENACVLQIEVYEQDGLPSPVDAFLAMHGYRQFWQIGADRYYAAEQRCPTSEQLLEIVARAHRAMIADLKQLGIPGLDPSGSSITRRIGPLQISLFDPIAGWLRRLFKRA